MRSRQFSQPVAISTTIKTSRGGIVVFNSATNTSNLFSQCSCSKGEHQRKYSEDFDTDKNTVKWSSLPLQYIFVFYFEFQKYCGIIKIESNRMRKFPFDRVFFFIQFLLSAVFDLRKYSTQYFWAFDNIGCCINDWCEFDHEPIKYLIESASGNKLETICSDVF